MTAFTSNSARSLLETLCRRFPDRHVGGPGNRAATELFGRTAAELGFAVESAELPCVTWERGEARIAAASGSFAVQPGPYSLPCEARARLAAASSVEELERGGFEGSVLLVHGDLAREQLAPKNFPFYNPEPHQRIVAALERARPLAVVAATGQNPETSGGLYPFPLIDDGDFDLPSAFMTDVEGARLLKSAGEEVAISIGSGRVRSTAAQLVARKAGTGSKRLLFFAHIDSKEGSPGALDNAAGVAALFGLAELLRDYRGPHAIEIVPFNGEDYFAATGQLHWLAQNQGKLGDVLLGLNADGAGFVDQPVAVSFYGCPAKVEQAVRAAMPQEGFVEGPQWPQSDHSLLVFQGVPAVALTSENAFFVSSTVAHTSKDLPELVDPEKVVAVSRFFAEVVARLAGY